MSTQEQGVSQSFQNTFSPTVPFARGVGIFLICATVTNIISEAFTIAIPALAKNDVIWFTTLLVTSGFGLSLIVLAMTANKGTVKFGFLTALVLLMINIFITTQLLKVDRFLFIANFPLYFDFINTHITPYTLLIQGVIAFLVLPALVGISLIISGNSTRRTSVLGRWKNTPVLLGVWLILSVLLALPVLAILSHTYVGEIAGGFLLDLPKSILLIFMGIGLWQIKGSK